jgi:hypothetical protein
MLEKEDNHGSTDWKRYVRDHLAHLAIELDLTCEIQYAAGGFRWRPLASLRACSTAWSRTTRRP